MRTHRANHHAELVDELRDLRFTPGRIRALLARRDRGEPRLNALQVRKDGMVDAIGTTVFRFEGAESADRRRDEHRLQRDRDSLCRLIVVELTVVPKWTLFETIRVNPAAALKCTTSAYATGWATILSLRAGVSSCDDSKHLPTRCAKVHVWAAGSLVHAFRGRSTY